METGMERARHGGRWAVGARGLAVAVAVASAACGGEDGFADASDAGREAAADAGPRPPVMGTAACQRVLDWNNRGSSACTACASGMCATQHSGLDTGCIIELQDCNQRCTGASQCDCTAMCLMNGPAGGTPVAGCYEAWTAYNECVGNGCDAQCR
jgi:hypothetical protein